MVLDHPDAFLFSPQKPKGAVSQPLPQVANGDGELQSSAVTHTAAPASPSATPTQAVTADPQMVSHLPTSEEPSPHALQQPATSTTETPVRAAPKWTLTQCSANVSDASHNPSNE